MSTSTSAVGIEPVPRGDRTLGALDLAVLWGDLGIGLLVLVTGAILVPALGFGTALVVILLGSVIGVLLLALVAAAGAAHGIPTMVLLRPLLGVRGSWIPTFFNVVQLVGWTAVEFWAMSYVADLVADRVFGFSARGLWLILAGIVCTLLALWGPVGVTRVWLERFGVWVIGAISLAVTVLVFVSGDVDRLLSYSPVGGFPTFGAGLDLVIAMPISWLPLVADYTRFGRSPRDAFAGTFVGYLIANVWLYALGAAIVMSATTTPDPAGMAAGILSLAGGSIAGILFLVGLLVGETDEAFADIYSGAVSLQNIWPQVSQKVLIAGIATVSLGLAAWLTMERYEGFLFLIGSVFVPLFGVFLVDHFIVRRGRIDAFRADIRLPVFVPWLAGFVVYQWVSPSGAFQWWIDLFSVFGTPLGERLPWLSASLAALIVSGAVTLAFSRRAEDRGLSSGQPASDNEVTG